MKKVIVLFVAVVSFAAVQAQIAYGAKGGFNLSNVRGSDVSGNKTKVGIHLGGYVAIPVADQITVQPELVFSTQGDKVSHKGSPDSKLNTSYLNIPVLAKYTAASGFFGETGPQFGFLLSAKAKEGSDKTDVRDSFKKFDLSWALGVGYMTNFDLGINLRYNFGITKLDVDGDVKVYNSVIQAGVFYKLGSR
jgi:hypothetical protein